MRVKVKFACDEPACTATLAIDSGKSLTLDHMLRAVEAGWAVTPRGHYCPKHTAAPARNPKKVETPHE